MICDVNVFKCFIEELSAFNEKLTDNVNKIDIFVQNNTANKYSDGNDGYYYLRYDHLMDSFKQVRDIELCTEFFYILEKYRIKELSTSNENILKIFNIQRVDVDGDYSKSNEVTAGLKLYMIRDNIHSTYYHISETDKWYQDRKQPDWRKDVILGYYITSLKQWFTKEELINKFK